MASRLNEVASGILSLEVVGSSRPNIVHWGRTIFPSAEDSSFGNLSQVGISKLVQNIVLSDRNNVSSADSSFLHDS